MRVLFLGELLYNFSFRKRDSRVDTKPVWCKTNYLESNNLQWRKSSPISRYSLARLIFIWNKKTDDSSFKLFADQNGAIKLNVVDTNCWHPGDIIHVNLLYIFIKTDAVLTELGFGTGHHRGYTRFSLVIFMVNRLTSFGLDILIIDHVCGSKNVSTQKKDAW